MTEKDVEIQELRREIEKLKKEKGEYQYALKWTRDKLKELEDKMNER